MAIFRGDEEIVYLSHADAPSWSFPGSASLSGHAVLNPEWGCWVVPNMDKDWRFANNPTRKSGGRRPVFYASAPLRYHRGEGDSVDFGALVIADTVERDFDAREQAMLLRLANMLVFQLATLQSEVMAKKSSEMYESSISFLNRSFIPDHLKEGGTKPAVKAKKKETKREKKLTPLSPQARHHPHGSQSAHRQSLLSLPQTSSPRTSPAPSQETPTPTVTSPTPPVRATKTAPRDSKRTKRRDLEAEQRLFVDAAQTLRGILGADAVSMVDLRVFQLFLRRKTTAPQDEGMTKGTIVADFLQGKPWPDNFEPVVNFSASSAYEDARVLGQNCAPGFEFDFHQPDTHEVLSQFIKRYLLTRHNWWDREDPNDELAKQMFLFMPDQAKTVLATVFLTYSGAPRYATFAVWSRPPCAFDDSSRLALPFVWIISAALASSLAILRMRAIEESQITYSNIQAHELRTPLHQILAITQLLRSSMSDLAEGPVPSRDPGLNTLQQVRDLLPFLDAIDTSGATLHGIVENILTFLDLSAKDNRWGGAPGNPTVMSRTGAPQTLGNMLEELIHDAYEDDRRSRIGTGQALDHTETIFEIRSPDLGELVTEDHGGALRRALARVIHNAYRFIDGPGCVEIYVDDVKSMLPPEGCEELATTRRISITVADNGRGMSPEFVRDKLGEPWAKEDLYATGSGLSVHLAYRIIDLMNGEMDISSAPGHGCTVTIEVPVPVARSPPQIPPFQARKVALMGFDSSTGAIRLASSLEKQYRDLGCDIVDVEDAELVVADCGLEEHPTGLMELAQVDAPEVVILAATHEDEYNVVASMTTPNRRVRRVMKPVTPTIIRQTLSTPVSSAPPTPGDGTEIRPRLRTHFDSAALARPGGNPQTPTGAMSWKPKGVCVEEAVASLCLGDYFSSRQRLYRASSGSSSNPLDTSSDTDGVRTDTPSNFTASDIDSRYTAQSSTPVTTPDEDPREVVVEKKPVPAKTQVLVVEDNIINRKILVKILKAAVSQLDIHEAEDGEDAVARFRELDVPVIVLLDINMPRMDGYAAAQEMRMIEKRRASESSGAFDDGTVSPLVRSKIIAVTALSGEDERHRGLVECGMDNWVTKPLDRATLQRIMDDACQELSKWA